MRSTHEFKFPYYSKIRGVGGIPTPKSECLIYFDTFNMGWFWFHFNENQGSIFKKNVAPFSIRRVSRLYSVMTPKQ